MEYVQVIYKFFAEHWDQVREAAEAVVAAWIIIGGLAPKLAERLREVRDRALKR